MPYCLFFRDSITYISKDIILGQSWWVMLPCRKRNKHFSARLNVTISVVCNNTMLVTEIKDLEDHDQHLIAKACEEGESSIRKCESFKIFFITFLDLTFFLFRFNMMIVPSVAVLGLISTGLAFVKFDMALD